MIINPTNQLSTSALESSKFNSYVGNVTDTTWVEWAAMGMEWYTGDVDKLDPPVNSTPPRFKIEIASRAIELRHLPMTDSSTCICDAARQTHQEREVK